MPDITMCEGRNCPIRDKCYRYKAIPSKFMQSYFTAKGLYTEKGCTELWDMSKKRKGYYETTR